MRSIKRLFCAVALLGVALAGIVSVDFTQNSDIDKQAGNIQVNPGDLIKVTLAETPSTGFLWLYEDPMTKNQGVYSVDMDSFTANPDPNNMAG